MLLRARLQQMARASHQRDVPAARKESANLLANVRRMAKRDGLKDDELERTLIEALLAEEFGQAITGEVRFQQIANQVLDIIKRDQEARSLMRDVVTKLRTSDP